LLDVGRDLGALQVAAHVHVERDLGEPRLGHGVLDPELLGDGGADLLVVERPQARGAGGLEGLLGLGRVELGALGWGRGLAAALAALVATLALGARGLLGLGALGRVRLVVFVLGHSFLCLQGFLCFQALPRTAPRTLPPLTAMRTLEPSSRVWKRTR